jgi:tRNA A-37 threonylcarbamoyl transferase component Bud32/tetratricopeptide (TPR) repeat protein
MNDEPTAPIQRLYELFDRVVDLPAEGRDAELARIEAGDPALASDLRALLAHAARADSPLDAPPLPQIPGFRIHRCIGRGGSSTVYLADQKHVEFTRQVALKVIDRPFEMDSLRSVREEQRILARLEHRGIARLYDSGVTPWGQHWLAMEHVEGESILAHCNSRQLSVSERIELFRPVLDAVAYAHARGIIHRDLKPANIFLTPGGEARLLDFGIAKLSDPADQDETRTLRRALTPAYASPEQVRGDRTTAASDIYSLGVVLYELLAGVLPRLGESNETQPLPASVAFERRALRGDLDAILDKALRPRPEERYASATDMAADLRNALAGAPVTARRGEWMYRARKLARRYRAAVAVVMATLLLAAGLQIAGRWRAAWPGNEIAIYRDARLVDSETRRWLQDGAERLARFDGVGARDSFRRATLSSKGRLPGEALAWDGVARAESSLGEIGRAAEAARRAGALIAGHRDVLPAQEAERLRARALSANRDWNAAIPALEGSFSAQPERVDIGLDLVSTLLACGHTDAADTALGRLRQIATGNEDPRIDLIEAEVALQLSEDQRAAAAASRAGDRAARVHAVALGQRAARIHAEAIGLLDRRDDARRELTAVIARDQALGLTGEAAAARLSFAFVMLRVVDREEGRRILDAALAGCAAAGDRRCEISARTLLAMMDGMEGKLAEAIRAANTALADARALGDRWCEGYVLSQLGVLYSWADDRAALQGIEEPLLAALRDSGNRRTLSLTLTNFAVVSIEALDLEKAEAYIVEAEGLARRVGSQLGSASIDRARGYLEETRGDLDLARKSYTSALDKARQAAVPWTIGNYLSDLAWLEVGADRPGPAAERAREAIAVFTSVGDKIMAANTEGALAWSEARQGNRAAAQLHMAALRQVLTADGSDTARFTLLDSEAHLAAAVGDWRRAIEIRREMVRMATEWKARGVVIRQQTGLAEALHQAGERRALEKLVAGMLPEVESHGLRGIARELRALVSSH